MPKTNLNRRAFLQVTALASGSFMLGLYPKAAALAQGPQQAAPSQDEGAADLAGGVVKGGAAIAAFADGPVEDLVVEVGGARDVGGGELEVADFSVGHDWIPRGMR